MIAGVLVISGIAVMLINSFCFFSNTVQNAGIIMSVSGVFAPAAGSLVSFLRHKKPLKK